MSDTSNLIDLFCRKSKAVKSRASRGRKRELSTSAQEARGRAVATELGLTVRHVWIEVGSASRFSKRKQRDEQDKALDALVKGETGALWVYKLDRWDRTGAGAILKIIEPEDGIPRRLLFDNGDPDNPGIGLDSTNRRDRGELIRAAERAREETDLLSERVTDTKAHQRSTGQWVQGRAPYGTEIVIVEDPDDPEEERRTLRRCDEPADPDRPEGPTKGDIARRIIVETADDEPSTRRMAATLEDEGFPGPRGPGSKWIHTTVRSMIHNPIYAGWQTIRPNGTTRHQVFRDEKGNRVRVWEGLVTDAEQHAAMDRLSGVQHSPKTQRMMQAGGRARHLITSYTFCTGDGSRMQHNGKGYKCSRWEYCPRPAFVSRKPIEEYVFERWITRLGASTPGDPLQTLVAQRWAALVQPEETAEARQAAEALKSAEAAMKRLEKDRRAGLYDGAAEPLYAPAMREAIADVDVARKRVKQTASASSLDIDFLVDPLQAREAWEGADSALRRELIRLAITRIDVAKAPYHAAPWNGDKRVWITWVDGHSDHEVGPLDIAA
ncbi:recombinase family protein [Streptomyces sp. URMC 124]|uniref:recombinase family protein n=1 Tax=Streptomyces sp. URMC 124 TaxID=3423405 RepID=UPI003F1BE99D